MGPHRTGCFCGGEKTNSHIASVTAHRFVSFMISSALCIVSTFARAAGRFAAVFLRRLPFLAALVAFLVTGFAAFFTFFAIALLCLSAPDVES